jgi:hypothetical protein
MVTKVVGIPELGTDFHPALTPGPQVGLFEGQCGQKHQVSRATILLAVE